MVDRIDEQPTPKNQKINEKRSGKDRRKVHTMINPTTKLNIIIN